MSALPTVLVVAQFQEHARTGHSCVQDNGFCPSWIADNWDRYTTPLLQHVELTVIALVAGFAIALGLALIAHRRRWLVPPIIAITGVMYTLPSIAVFFILQPVTGRGRTTALIALTAYTLLILFRNMLTGLREVPTEVKEAAEGMGLTRRQMLLRVEIPLAMPAIVAGVRVATVTTISLATIAAFITPLGLGAPIFNAIQSGANTEFVGASLLAIALALLADVLIVTLQRVVSPWTRARRQSA